MACLILRLEGPLAAYGAERVDHLGPVRPFPGLSTLSGLLANALGLDRRDSPALTDLQNRLRLACRIDRNSAHHVVLTDYQTVRLAQDDTAWTTSGKAAVRTSSPATYEAPLITPKDYTVDTLIHVAVALSPPGNGSQPTLDDIAGALQNPFRPLFLGRKTCLPSAYLYQGKDDRSHSPLQSLLQLPPLPETEPLVRFFWSADDTAGDKTPTPQRTSRLSDQRDFDSGPHKGARRVCEATLHRDELPIP